MRNNKLYIFTILSLLLFGCEDVITIDLPQGKTQIVVDGFINNKFEKQRIRLINTNGYFDPNTPPLVENANVRVIDLVNSKTITFTYESDGYYTWTPPTEADTLIVRQRPADFDRDGDGRYDNYYKLEVDVNFQEQDLSFEAYTSLERVPPIDSLIFKTSREEKEEDEKITAELWAKDYAGPNDCYWIKTFRNGDFLNKSNELLIAFDITPGRSDFGDILTEDTYFIPPIRGGINPSRSEEEIENNAPLYQIGDSVYCEIHSITENAFDFLSQSRTQMSNGGLFARPLANVPTNIIATNDQSEGLVIGIFCGSAISYKGHRITTKPPYED
ncbi:DUF4249 domain-containing protein [Flammeovirga sp. EKP202]|uniref:DUF4249 domain-containing protein n=1 Tax=Flammeovirga sp. EKP202 TaxID=2770592 RepID=UPI00165FFFE4|nr:DUF4249 domain-containing protein [Flammeovirga sp. EKP202]MBD0401338.1 DUF4249 domain-containing protein [Flammeovirga sp. EKP202]